MQPYFLPNHPIPKTAFQSPAPTYPRPAGQRPICDAWLPVPTPGPAAQPGPRLRRCRRHAAFRLTLLTAAECITVNRCPACANELREQARAGATFEIIADSEYELETKKELPMTNRIEYTETLVEPTTKEQEILWIANLLAEMGKPATIHNAQAVLSLGLQNAPERWLLTMADLVVLWPRLVHKEA